MDLIINNKILEMIKSICNENRLKLSFHSDRSGSSCNTRHNSIDLYGSNGFFKYTLNKVGMKDFLGAMKNVHLGYDYEMLQAFLHEFCHIKLHWKHTEKNYIILQNQMEASRNSMTEYYNSKMEHTCNRFARYHYKQIMKKLTVKN